jgi:23S rRNA (pseudouridine1915-N3)-methyltransferase
LKSIKIIVVGKLKKPFWSEAAEHYLGPLSRFARTERLIVKDAPAHLPPAERITREAEAIRAKITPQDLVVCLDQHGQPLTSPDLAVQLGKWIEDPQKRPCFVIGGAYGLAEDLLSGCDKLLGLGPMTLPHELAQVILLEQLYRAVAILQNLPYHH